MHLCVISTLSEYVCLNMQLCAVLMLLSGHLLVTKYICTGAVLKYWTVFHFLGATLCSLPHNG